MERFVPFTSKLTREIIWFSIPDAILIGLCVFIICLPLFKHETIKTKVFISILFMYSSAVLSITAFPYLIGKIGFSDINTTKYILSRVSLKPFESIMRIYKNGIVYGNIRAIISNIGGNFIMLIPLGILLPLINPKTGIFKLLLIAVISAVSLELIQLVQNIMYGFSNRDVNIDDFILNFTGFIFGYIIFVVVKWLCKIIQNKSETCNNLF